VAISGPDMAGGRIRKSRPTNGRKVFPNRGRARGLIRARNRHRTGNLMGKQARRVIHNPDHAFPDQFSAPRRQPPAPSRPGTPRLINRPKGRRWKDQPEKGRPCFPGRVHIPVRRRKA